MRFRYSHIDFSSQFSADSGECFSHPASYERGANAARPAAGEAPRQRTRQLIRWYRRRLSAGARGSLVRNRRASLAWLSDAVSGTERGERPRLIRRRSAMCQQDDHRPVARQSGAREDARVLRHVYRKSMLSTQSLNGGDRIRYRVVTEAGRSPESQHAIAGRCRWALVAAALCGPSCENAGPAAAARSRLRSLGASARQRLRVEPRTPERGRREAQPSWDGRSR